MSPVASRRPEGSKARAWTAVAWPGRTRSGEPVSASHSRIADRWSMPPPVASSEPSGLYASPVDAGSLCPPTPQRAGRVRVPDDDVVIVGRRGQPGQAGVEGQAVRAVDVADQPSPLAAAPELVEARGPVGAAHGEVLAVRAERDGVHEPAARQDRQGLAGPGVPDPCGVVVARGRDPVAVGAEGEIGHLLLVPAEGDPFLAAGHVPERGGLVP